MRRAGSARAVRRSWTRDSRFLWGMALGLLAAASPAGRTLAQRPTHAVHPLMPGERLYLRCQLLTLRPPAAVVAPLAIQSPLIGQQPDQLIELPDGAPPIRVLRYLPSAVLEQSVVPTSNNTGRPAVEVSIDGPTQTHRRWLVADDPDRNRLVSYIGAWRYLSVANQSERAELLRQFETEYTRDPMLIVSRADGGGGRPVAIHVDDVQALDDLGCKIRVREFYPDYAMDRATLIPINQSDRRRNPAALVEIEHDGVTEARWVFAKFPGFQSREGEKLPYQVSLDCPAQSAGDVPDFVLVTIGGQSNEVWQRSAGGSTSRRLEQDEAVAIPHSQYRFRVMNFVPNGRMVEEYRSAEQGEGGPALEIEFTDGSGTATKLWLELGHHRTVATPAGPMIVSFGGKDKEAPQGIHP